MKFALLFLCSYLSAHSLRAQNKGDQLFSETVHLIHINSTTEPDLHQVLQNDANGPDFDFPYHQVNMIIDGEPIDSVGIRVKGFFSTIGSPTPLKIDINEYVDDKTFDGLKKFNLNNSFLDEFKQRDRIAYELLRRTGVPAPRTAYAEVYINNVFIDVYLIVEQIDKVFIKQNFASDNGSLLKIMDVKFGDPAIFDNFYNEDLSFSALSEVLDVREYFKFLLINIFIQAGDNYPLNGNNFYIYYDPKDELYHYMSWDHNLSFSLAAYTAGIFTIIQSHQYMNDPLARELFLEVACDFYHYGLDETYITNLINDTKALIHSNSQGVTVAEPDPLLEYILARKDWLMNELMANQFDCEAIQYPNDPGALVINEFVAQSDSLAGVQEPDGGTPDWIELYNNSDKDIMLDHHYYVSDDVDFPKKWNFRESTLLPAKEYLILWADRDLNQQGIHTNFKIDKDFGNLLLTYEDMTLIDQVNYEEQVLNHGYARIPNGVGDFVIQNPTFAATNDDVSNTIDLTENILQIMPNPASATVRIQSEQTIERLSAFSSDGQEILRTKNPSSELDISNWPDGIYFIHVNSGEKNQTIKLVKQGR